MEGGDGGREILPGEALKRDQSAFGGGGGVLPYMGYIGMCSPKG